MKRIEKRIRAVPSAEEVDTDPQNKEPLRVTRTYTVRLRGDARSQQALWQTHLAMNRGSEVFADWLLTMAGGLSHEEVPPRERVLVALSWFSVETGGAGSLQTIEREGVVKQLEKILRKRGAGAGEIVEWLAQVSPSLLCEIREDAVWVDRSQQFDQMCRSLRIKDIGKAREDARVILTHLFGAKVFIASTDNDDDEENVKGGSAGAGKKSSHLFSHLLGSAEQGFGRVGETAQGEPLRNKLHYFAEWGAYLERRLLEEVGVKKTTQEERKELKEATGDVVRSNDLLMRDMIYQACERLAGHRTKLRLQEDERVKLRSADHELRALEEDSETAPIAERLDRWREERAQETGALGIYVFTKRALVGWTELVKSWGEEDCRTEEERRAVCVRLQADAKGGKWGDQTLYDALCADEMIPVWRAGNGALRPELLQRYAAGWLARRDAERLKVAAFRHIDPYEHPVYARFGVSRPDVRLYVDEARTMNASPVVSLVLWDGLKMSPFTFTASSLRLVGDLLPDAQSDDGPVVQPSRRTRLAALALRSAQVERALTASALKTEMPNEWAGLESAFEGKPGATLLTERENLASAHEQERHLRWQLSLSLDLLPQGPWPEFIKRVADRIEPDEQKGMIRPSAFNLRVSRWRGLAFPFTRQDIDVGRGGELSSLPGVRVLGVDMRWRYGAACALWESVTLKEFRKFARDARSEGRTVRIEPLWARIEGVGLFRRAGDDHECSAPWARLLRREVVFLDGEKDSMVRSVNADERPYVDELATLVEEEPIAEGTSFYRAVNHLMTIMRRFQGRQNSLARIAAALNSNTEPANWAKLLMMSHGFTAEEVGRKKPEVAALAVARWHERNDTARRCLSLFKKLLQPSKHNLHAPGKGGLGLDRIELLEEFYRAQKAYYCRPTPDAPMGRPPAENLAYNLRRKIARLKRQRVRQMTARIMSYAFGEDAQGEARFPYAHALVIEDLRGYRFSETQSRRSNRGLASWVVASVRDALAESCQLHGVHLREVEASYTSKQDARTAQAALRCIEMTDRQFIGSSFWRNQCERAARRIGTASETGRDILLNHLRTAIPETNGEHAPQNILVPAEEGHLVVRIDEEGRVSKYHAGLNAAANIGFAVLRDPHHPSAHWRIASTWDQRRKAFRPAKDKGGLLTDWQVQIASNGHQPGDKGKIINLWRDPSVQPLTEGEWLPSRQYWQHHERVICEALRFWRG